MMTKSEMGKKSRRDGMAFERKVRKDLESKGWIVDKWTNNVDIPKPCGNIFKHSNNGAQVGCVLNELCLDCRLKLHPAKSFRGITRSNGFPDFIAFKQDITNHSEIWKKYAYRKGYTSYEVIAVESKMDGILDKTEKDKCRWYLDNNIFSKILIASKGTIRGSIVYKEFK